MHRTALLALALTACLLPTTVGAGERLDSDAFAAADGAAAWTPFDGSGPVAAAPESTPEGNPAVAFHFDMSNLTERAYWDRAVALDLSRFGRIAFWVRAEGDLSAVGHCSFYLHSGAGWYAASFGLPDEGWQRVVIDRGSFTTEGTPQGWSAIDTVRVVLLEGTAPAGDHLSGWTRGDGERCGRSAEHARRQRSRVLHQRDGEHAARAPASTPARWTIVDVEAGVLAGKHIAIYPLNPSPSDKEMEALEAFVRGRRPGGGVLLAVAAAGRAARSGAPGSSVQRVSGAVRPYALPARRAPGPAGRGKAGLLEHRTGAACGDGSARDCGMDGRSRARTRAIRPSSSATPAPTFPTCCSTTTRSTRTAWCGRCSGHLYPDLWEQMARHARSTGRAR